MLNDYDLDEMRRKREADLKKIKRDVDRAWESFMKWCDYIEYECSE